MRISPLTNKKLCVLFRHAHRPQEREGEEEIKHIDPLSLSKVVMNNFPSCRNKSSLSKIMLVITIPLSHN